MGVILPKADRAKLAKVLTLLGSDKAGERDAAALAAHRMLQQRGVTWADVMNPPAVEKALPELGAWRKTCAELMKRSESLRPWERGFIQDLPKFHRLSVKQRYVLKEISERVLGNAA